jgi:hypothetical protein
MNVRSLNPFNFVRCGPSVARKPLSSDGHGAFSGFSGVLHCRLEALTHIFIPSSQPPAVVNQHKNLGHFNQVNGVWMIPGSSLRGPVRSVAEAASNSCFSVFDREYTDPRQKGVIIHRNLVPELEPCPRQDHFCPACRLFGTAGQEQLSSVGWRGKVRFTDARYIAGEGEDDEKTLHELSSPKLAHTIYYGRHSPAPGDPVAQRKFYYHHRPGEIKTQTATTKRNKTVIPLKPGAIFEFDVWCDNLRR